MKKKVCTSDNKPLVEIKEGVLLPVTYSNEASLLMHTGLAAGEHEGKKFRFIQSVCNRGFRLEWGDYHIDFDTKDLVNVLMAKFVELKKRKKPRKGK